MKKIIQNNPVVAILRNTPDDILKAYADSLYRGGIRAFEVSFSADNADHQIRILKEYLPEDALVGAGTVLNLDLLRRALAAQADFILSPSSDPEVLAYCRDHAIPLLPGVFTPSDVSLCLSYGFDTLKLFPANALPLNYVKSLKGPFPQTSYVAVGGVSPENKDEFFRAGCIGVGIGSSLVPKEMFENQDWDGITAYIRKMM